MFQKLNYLLDAYFEDIWKMINMPASMLQEPQRESEASTDDTMSAAVEQIDSKQKEEPVAEINVKNDFYTHVLGAITRHVLNELSVQNIDYMISIQLFFKIVLSKFFARDHASQILTDICSSFFDSN